MSEILYCSECDYATSPDAVRANQALTMHRRAKHGDVPTATDDSAPAAADTSIYASPEAPPSNGSRPRLRDRIRRKEKAPKDPNRPARRSSREKADHVLGMMWGGAGWMLIQTGGANIPSGRVMQFQTEAAGPILDRLIAGTFIDHLIQPLARRTEALEEAGALLAAPIMAGMMARSEGAGVMLEPMFRQVLAQNIIAMAPVVKRRKADEAKMAAVLEDMGIDSEADAVTALINQIFAPVGTPPVEEPEPAGV